jgi:hypothetical protein
MDIITAKPTLENGKEAWVLMNEIFEKLEAPLMRCLWLFGIKELDHRRRTDVEKKMLQSLLVKCAKIN